MNQPKVHTHINNTFIYPQHDSTVTYKNVGESSSQPRRNWGLEKEEKWSITVMFFSFDLKEASVFFVVVVELP